MDNQKSIAINGRFLTQSVTGVQRYARELLRALDDVLNDGRGPRVRLLTPRLSQDPPLLKNISHQTVGRFQGHAWEQMELPRYVDRDILFCPANIAPVLSLYGRSRVVVTVHDLSYLYFPDAYAPTFRLVYGLVVPLVLRRASSVITVSNSERAAITERYPQILPRISAIQNGGMPGDAPPVMHVSADDKFVLYVGSLSKRKNLAGLIEVSARLARKRGLRFVFVGGTPKYLTEAISHVPEELRSRLHFAGQIDDWDVLQSYYRSATAFFFPSFYEASPLPPIEAMGCGCPVIASSIPSLLERCGDAAVYCDPHSVDDMIRAIERLLDDPELQDSLRARGYQRAQEFSWKNCAVETLHRILE
jgi:glycosyltransferase involved in cell wall biosynthesis